MTPRGKMRGHDIHEFPSVEQSICMGVGDLEHFFFGTPWEKDHRVTAFREATDALMDLMMEIHENEERDAGAMCVSCQDHKARVAGWEPSDGKAWIHRASNTIAATLKDALETIDKGIPGGA